MDAESCASFQDLQSYPAWMHEVLQALQSPSGVHVVRDLPKKFSWAQDDFCFN